MRPLFFFLFFVSAPPCNQERQKKKEEEMEGQSHKRNSHLYAADEGCDRRAHVCRIGWAPRYERWTMRRLQAAESKMGSAARCDEQQRCGRLAFVRAMQQEHVRMADECEQRQRAHDDAFCGALNSSQSLSSRSGPSALFHL